MRRTRIAIISLVTLSIAASCADDPRAGAGGGVPHPRGADQVVLRLSYEGGFVPVEYHLTQIPAFTLFGDGSIVVPGPQIEIYPGPALPAVSRQRVSADGIQAIIQAALDAGLGEGDRDLTEFGSTLVADASTAVFTFSADGETSRVKVYALAELPERPAGMSEEEFEARRALSDLAARLTALGQWLPEGSLGSEEPYEAGGYRLFVGPYRPAEELPQEPVAWPLTSPLPAPDHEAGFACLVVSGQDWATLEPLARNANELTPWTTEGANHTVLFRPLLPDESGC